MCVMLEAILPDEKHNRLTGMLQFPDLLIPLFHLFGDGRL